MRCICGQEEWFVKRMIKHQLRCKVYERLLRAYIDNANTNLLKAVKETGRNK